MSHGTQLEQFAAPAIAAFIVDSYVTIATAYGESLDARGIEVTDPDRVRVILSDGNSRELHRSELRHIVIQLTADVIE